MKNLTLADAALALIRRHVQEGEIPIDDSNIELHRDLAGLGLMVAVHTFTGGREQAYRFTREGWDLVCNMESA